MKKYEEAIRRNPEVAKYHSNLGTAYIKLMEFARARDCFGTALEKDPKFIKAYPKKGDCHFFLKEYHRALEIYEAGLKIDPENELCKQGIIKTQQAIYSSSSQEDQEARARRAMSDPEIQTILQTPEVRNALAEMERDPKSIQNILQNRDLALKIQKLIDAGVLKVG